MVFSKKLQASRKIEPTSNNNGNSNGTTNCIHSQVNSHNNNNSNNNEGELNVKINLNENVSKTTCANSGNEQPNNDDEEEEEEEEEEETEPTPSTAISTSTVSSSEITAKVSISSSSSSFKYIFLVDLLLSSFVFTPLVVVFWASTWDIIYLFVFPNDFFLSILIPFLFSTTVLLLCYLFQDKLKKFHQKLRKQSADSEFVNRSNLNLGINEQTSSNDSTISDTISDEKFKSKIIITKNNKLSYYGKDFYFRCLYTYVLTVCYVCNWKTWWDLYTQYTQDIHWIFFLIVSIIALVIYRFVLKKSLNNFTKTVPFYLIKDTQFDDYFVQPISICLKNKLCGLLANFFYFEIIEMIISTCAWKGIWDLLDATTKLFDPDPYNVFYSCLLTGLAGYVLLYLLISIEFNFLSLKYFKKHPNFKSFIEELVLFLAYLSITFIWRTYWTLYDHYFLEFELKNYAVISTNLIFFIILCYSKCVTSLYGLSGSSIEKSEDESHVNDVERNMASILNKNQDSKCFDIKYLS